MTCPYSELVVEKKGASLCETHVDSTKARIEKLVQQDKNAKSRKVQARCLYLPPESSLRKDLWHQILTTANLLIPLSSSTQLRNITSSFNGYELADKKLVSTYKLSEQGILNLRQCLYQISIDSPELSYFPELWPMTAVLLHYLSINDTISTLNNLIKNQYFLAQTKYEWFQRCLSMRFLIDKSKFHELCRTYPAQSVKTALLHWIIAVWNLPFTHLVCVIDCFLVEGWKVFYRAGLVITSLALKTNAPPNLVQAARNVTISPRALLQTMFSIRNFSKSKISAGLIKAQETLDETDLSLNCDNSNENASLHHSHLHLLCVHSQHHHHADVQLKRNSICYQVAGEKELLDGIYEPCLPKDVGTVAAYQVHDPHLKHESKIITLAEMGSIVSAIEDERLAKLSKPKLVFTTATDGTSLKTLLSRTGEGPSIILIRSISGKSVVGAFCSDQWAMKPHDPFFGRGISFVFSLRPLKIHPWCHENSLSKFQRVTNDSLEVGGGVGSGSAAIQLDSNLAHCRSGPSPTFNSPPLFADPSDCTDQSPLNRCIVVGELELFALQDLD